MPRKPKLSPKPSRGQLELQEAAYFDVLEFQDDFNRGLWFEATTRHGDKVAVLRQNSRLWHWFLQDGQVTGTGDSPVTVLFSRKLGEGLEDGSSELSELIFLVRTSPKRLTRKYKGLRWAVSLC